MKTPHFFLMTRCQTRRRNKFATLTHLKGHTHAFLFPSSALFLFLLLLLLLLLKLLLLLLMLLLCGLELLLLLLNIGGIPLALALPPPTLRGLYTAALLDGCHGLRLHLLDRLQASLCVKRCVVGV